MKGNFTYLTLNSYFKCIMYYAVLLFFPFIVSNRYLLFWVSNGHNSVTGQNWTHVYMKCFVHKDLGNHLLQLCPKIVKHPVYTFFVCDFLYEYIYVKFIFVFMYVCMEEFICVFFETCVYVYICMYESIFFCNWFLAPLQREYCKLYISLNILYM